MTNIEAMKLALDALENYGIEGTKSVGGQKCTKAIAALRQAISEAEQAEQEPVTFPANGLRQQEPSRHSPTDSQSNQSITAWRYKTNNTHTFYSSIEPPDDAYDEGTLEPLYTEPPQRQWVSLTDDEIAKIEERRYSNTVQKGKLQWDYLCSFARAIEAKLKEQNS